MPIEIMWLRFSFKLSRPSIGDDPGNGSSAVWHRASEQSFLQTMSVASSAMSR
jgi:hypothetical protein